MGHEDIITYEQDLVKIVFNPEVTDIFTDANYAPVIRALTKEFLTVKELIDKVKESTGIEKSAKTIYRYLKDLKKHGVIVQVGQRVTPGKKATEALFGKAARIIYFFQATKDFWTSEETKEESEILLKRMAKVFSSRWNIPEPGTKCLRELLIKNDEYIPEVMKGILEEYALQSEEEGHEFTSKEMYRIINLARSIVPMLETEFIEKEIKKCFPEKYKK